MKPHPRNTSRPGRSAPRRSRHTRLPRLELLEARTLLTTYVVTNTADSGPGSLRAAIASANASAGVPDVIVFDIPGTGVQTIRPLSEFPTISDPVVIDGYSQGTISTPDDASDDARANTLTVGNDARLLIELDGSLAGSGAAGLSLRTTHSTIRGLVINRFNDSGILLTGPATTRNLIVGNYIGTDVSGTAAAANSLDGVALVGTSSNTVGGAAEADRNVISGNGRNGVAFWGDSAQNLVAGNYIGTTADGSGSLGNVQNGVSLSGGGQNAIGGLGSGMGNVISANSHGIWIANTSDNRIAGNFIGTNAAGTVALGNGSGIAFYDFGLKRNITIGGPNEVLPDGTIRRTAGNVISGNGIGISLSGDVQGAAIQGNYIGTDVSGAKAISSGEGIRVGGLLAAHDVTIGGDLAGTGNVVSGHSGLGINIWQGSHDIVIAGNSIGTDVTGNSPLPNRRSGIRIEAYPPGSGDIIGIRVGTDGDGVGDDLERNIICANESGIDILGSERTYVLGAVVAGNSIGLSADGTTPMGNRAAGIHVGPNVDELMIGGKLPAQRNVISGDGWSGVYLNGAARVLVIGNDIGTDFTGTKAVTPRGHGFGSVQIENGAHDNTIGGLTEAERNVIVNGVVIRGAGTTRNLVVGNSIGTDRTGAAALGDGGPGVEIGEGAFDNTIGGTAAGPGNRISGNSAAGVRITGAGTVGNVIRGNAIFNNDGLGIDLGDDEVTFNGSHSPGSSGPNLWQTFPVVNVRRGGPSTVLSGTLDSVPGTSFVIDFYASTALDPLGHGEGERWLGHICVTTDAAGHADFDALLDVRTALGEWISATATGVNGTSEFSRAKPVDLIQVATSTTLTVSADRPLLRDSMTFTAAVLSEDANAGVPSGSVEFYDRGVLLGTRPLSGGGVATFVTQSLEIGSHSIAAVYVGDDEHLPSAAAPPTSVSVLAPASLSGIVYSDFNHDGEVDFNEKAVSGVTIKLTGTDDLGNAIELYLSTDEDGAYVFTRLRPGCYTITETQPAGYAQGVNRVGTAGGSVTLDRFDLCIGEGVLGLNYNFGERPTATGEVGQGQTAGIGFWNNRNGQALIKALNGGAASTSLGNWLSATFPRTFGVSSGASNLTGKSNADVAAFFQGRFVLKGEKLDAQVLATALAVYVTNATLNSTGVGSQYGFVIAGDGVGTATFSVGSNGEAFGVSDGTVMTVLDLLLAVDLRSTNGVLYNGNTAKRTKANNVFGAINQAGRI